MSALCHHSSIMYKSNQTQSRHTDQTCNLNKEAWHILESEVKRVHTLTIDYTHDDISSSPQPKNNALMRKQRSGKMSCTYFVRREKLHFNCDNRKLT